MSSKAALAQPWHTAVFCFPMSCSAKQEERFGWINLHGMGPNKGSKDFVEIPQKMDNRHTYYEAQLFEASLKTVFTLVAPIFKTSRDEGGKMGQRSVK